MDIIKGRVWIFQDNVDTDQILPGYAMAEPFNELGKYAMKGSEKVDFAKRVRVGDIIVAGKNFGCGSSREQAPVALKEAGVGSVIAASFARIFRRNAINIGMPVLEVDLREHFNEGDTISVDIAKGLIFKDNTTFYAAPLSKNALATLEAGGLIERVRKELGVEKRW